MYYRFVKVMLLKIKSEEIEIFCFLCFLFKGKDSLWHLTP